MQLVLLLLVIMWAGAGVYYFKGRPETHGSDSIGSFRNQLRVLERTAPAAVDAAHTLHPSSPEPRVLTPRPVAPSVQAARRRQTLKRRRDVFFGLCLGTAGSFFLGFVPGLRPMWALTLVLAIALAGYVAVLIQLRNRAAERSMKVRYLPQRDPMLMLRRSAN